MSFYSIALLLNCAIAFAVWPGFMSWDSLFALSEARNGITASNYPPIVSYIWRIVEIFAPGQGGMLLLQNGVLLLGIAHLLSLLQVRYWISVLILIGFVALPAILGPMLVVWKDVAMAAAVSLGFVFALQYSLSRSSMFFAASFCFLLLGAMYRLNAFPATFPMLAWLCWSWSRRGESPTKRDLAKSGFLFAFLAVITVATVGASLTWRLPDLRRIPPQFGQVWPQISDLVGISVCTRQVLVSREFLADEFTVTDLDAIYHPEHIQRSFAPLAGEKGLREAGFAAAGERIGALWWTAIVENPGCYLWHRGNVAKYLFGLNRGQVFYITHPGIDRNDLGIAMTVTPLTNRVLRWVLGNAASAGARFWVFFVAAGVLLTIAIVTRAPFRGAASVAFISGWLYSLTNVVTVPAADLRYQFWAFVAMFIVAVTAGLSLSRVPHGRSVATLDCLRVIRMSRPASFGET